MKPWRLPSLSHLIDSAPCLQSVSKCGIHHKSSLIKMPEISFRYIVEIVMISGVEICGSFYMVHTTWLS